MDSQTERILIVGVGNELLRDEGLGVHVARSLLSMKPSLPPNVDVLEAGTSLLDVLPLMPLYSRVVIVDAVRAGKRAGHIHRVEVTDETAGSFEAGASVSLHEMGVMEALKLGAMMGFRPGSLFIIGAEPEQIEPGTELSPRLGRAANRIISILLREIGKA
jgi:hydrogenase maturation protease